ncbi:MAG: hypothetical protein B7Z55_16690, partial [Planctomycetales bacterium 12-60-4]
AERKQQARERQSQLSQSSRPMVPGIASSTARPAQGSSVAEAPAVRSTTSKVSLRQVEPASAADPEAVTQSVSVVTPIGALTSLQTGDEFILTQERLLIGRSAECQLQVEDPAVSGRHCDLRFDGLHWRLNDLDSRNGTRVNGVAVRERELLSGDEITIGGRVRFRLTYGGPDVQPPRAKRNWNFVALLATLGALVATGWWVVANLTR